MKYKLTVVKLVLLSFSCKSYVDQLKLQALTISEEALLTYFSEIIEIYHLAPFSVQKLSLLQKIVSLEKSISTPRFIIEDLELKPTLLFLKLKFKCLKIDQDIKKLALEQDIQRKMKSTQELKISEYLAGSMNSENKRETTLSSFSLSTGQRVKEKLVRTQKYLPTSYYENLLKKLDRSMTSLEDLVQFWVDCRQNVRAYLFSETNLIEKILQLEQSILLCSDIPKNIQDDSLLSKFITQKVLADLIDASELLNGLREISHKVSSLFQNLKSSLSHGNALLFYDFQMLLRETYQQLALQIHSEQQKLGIILLNAPIENIQPFFMDHIAKIVKHVEKIQSPRLKFMRYMLKRANSLTAANADLFCSEYKRAKNLFLRNTSCGRKNVFSL
eukprot:snap_masked-scaffold_7-processed-gene-18.23-mRNA-1 protein AED:1.00 eAED:1.00 QI:0/-1/0/0/-1/1/1/0/387